jgi:hypothetical protein
MALTPTRAKQATARERVKAFLLANPDGVSKSKLRDEIGGNAGAFRRLLSSMEDCEEIVITDDFNPNWGPTKIVRHFDVVAREKAAA